MTKEDLIKLDRELEKDDSSTSAILRALRGYYFYYNSPNRETKPIKIHQHFCGNCCWGAGKISNSDSGRNGTWIGPFSDVIQIENFIRDNFEDLFNQIDKTCGCLKRK